MVRSNAAFTMRCESCKVPKKTSSKCQKWTLPCQNAQTCQSCVFQDKRFRQCVPRAKSSGGEKTPEGSQRVGEEDEDKVDGEGEDLHGSRAIIRWPRRLKSMQGQNCGNKEYSFMSLFMKPEKIT